MALSSAVLAHPTVIAQALGQGGPPDGNLTAAPGPEASGVAQWRTATRCQRPRSPPEVYASHRLDVPERRARPPFGRTDRAGSGAASTDLDAFMAQALTRRDVDRQTAGDYVLDEVETFEVIAPGHVPLVRKRRDYTWYVRDGVHVRSPVAIDGVPVPEADRRAYEDQWYQSELSRRALRTKRDQTRVDEGKAPASGAPSVNEPRFVSESYFMDFKFEPGNYYLAGLTVSLDVEPRIHYPSTPQPFSLINMPYVSAGGEARNLTCGKKVRRSNKFSKDPQNSAYYSHHSNGSQAVTSV